MKKSLILAASLGSMVALGAIAATTDEIIRLVYDSGNTAFRIVNFDGSPIGGGSSDLTVGTTTVTGGTDKFCLFDDGGTVGADAACQIDKVAGSLSNLGLDVANAITLGEVAGQITFEGATADAFETRIAVADPTVGDQTWTLPNAATAASRTFASLEANQTWGGVQTFNVQANLGTNGAMFIGSAAATHSSIQARAALTPTSGILATGTASNSWHLAEFGDIGFDYDNGPCGTGACQDPTFLIRSRNQTKTEWFALDHDGVRTNIRSGTGPVRNTPAETFGVQFNTTGTKVTCDETNRGSYFYEAGGAGVADVTYLCGKNSSDVYAWRDISEAIP